MKVYILMFNDYDSSDIVEVFDSYEKAEKALELIFKLSPKMFGCLNNLMYIALN